MAVTPVLTTGDDTIFPVNLYKGVDTNFVIDSGATIKASVVTKDKSIIILTPVAVLESETGSDWFNSLVVVRFDSVNTDAIDTALHKSALLEIQVDDGGKLTWFIKIKIEKGTIDQ